jgi:ADP-ribose pyrophosphatase YjhB (NUDIX family)
MKKDNSYGVLPVYFDGHEYWFLLVCLHSGKHRWFPKWHAEKNESDTVAARRELQEEVWISSVQLVPERSFIETYSFPHAWVWIDKTVHYFIWFLATKIPPVIQKKELLAAKRCSFDEAISTLTYDSTQKVLQEAMDYIHSLQ